MARVISSPTIVEAAGNLPKKIEEFVGRVNSGTSDLSVARMTSPAGWVEPGQSPAFDEWTLAAISHTVASSVGYRGVKRWRRLAFPDSWREMCQDTLCLGLGF